MALLAQLPEPEPLPPPPSSSGLLQRGRLATLRCFRGHGAHYTAGPTYDTVVFPEAAATAAAAGEAHCCRRVVASNGVLLVPGLLSAEECSLLISDVEQCCSTVAAAAAAAAAAPATDGLGAWGSSTYGEGWQRGFQRYRIPQLSDATGALVEEVLRERLLPFISREMPGVEDYLWAQSVAACAVPGCQLAPPAPRGGTQLGVLPYRFAPQEPAINRYTAGGLFPVHSDGQALTLNVLLRADGFEGGGTTFWQQSEAEAEVYSRYDEAAHAVATGEQAPAAPTAAAAPSITIQPTEAGVGVIFNGKVRHAGQAVTRGVRHVLVLSFSITNAEYVSNAAAKAAAKATARAPPLGTSTQRMTT
jgi:hypothetical protein